jgi:hypothetical protein
MDDELMEFPDRFETMTLSEEREFTNGFCPCVFFVKLPKSTPESSTSAPLFPQKRIVSDLSKREN